MAPKKEKTETEEISVGWNEEQPLEPMAPSAPTKKIRNRSNQKIELVIGDKVVVFPPHSTIEVPTNEPIPEGIGLQVR